eukprot:COSAG02_NODE_30_length_50867_cov_66.594331_9_plen_80_part_00
MQIFTILLGFLLTTIHFQFSIGIPYVYGIDHQNSCMNDGPPAVGLEVACPAQLACGYCQRRENGKSWRYHMVAGASREG